MKKIIKFFSFALMLILSVGVFAGCFGGSSATPITYNEFAEYVNNSSVIKTFTSYHYESTLSGKNHELNLPMEVKMTAEVKYVGENVSYYCELTAVNAYEKGTKMYKVYLYNDKLYVDNGVDKYWFEYNRNDYYSLPEDILSELDFVLDASQILKEAGNGGDFAIQNTRYSKKESGDKITFYLKANQTIDDSSYGTGESEITFKSNVVQKYLEEMYVYENDKLFMSDIKSIEAKDVTVKVPTVALYQEYQG